MNEFAIAVLSRLLAATVDLAAIALIVAVVLRVLAPQSARVRAVAWLLVPCAGLTALIWTPPIGCAAVPSLMVTAPAAAGGSSPSIAYWLGLVWLLGAAIQLLRGIADRVRLRGLLRRTTVAPRDLQRSVERHGRAARWQVPRVAVSHEVDSPALVGVFAPIILMPVTLDDGPAREWAIRHEVMHVALRDPWGALVFELAGIALFFHPAFWLARRRWAVAAEQACDRALVADAEESLDYATHLHGLARKMVRRRAAPAGLFAITSEVGRRIELLIEPPVGEPRLSRRARFAIGSAAAALFVTGSSPFSSPRLSDRHSSEPTTSAVTVPDATIPNGAAASPPASQRWLREFKFHLGSPPRDLDGGIVWETTYETTTR